MAQRGVGGKVWVAPPQVDGRRKILEGHRRANGGSSSEEALWGNLAPPPVGADWTRQGRIVFAQGPSEPVKRGDGQEEGGWGGRGKGGR